jgi:hypothetical protein
LVYVRKKCVDGGEGGGGGGHEKKFSPPKIKYVPPPLVQPQG